jgi:hypothetical protein
MVVSRLLLFVDMRLKVLVNAPQKLSFCERMVWEKTVFKCGVKSFSCFLCHRTHVHPSRRRKRKGRSVCPCRTRTIWVIIPPRNDNFQSWDGLPDITCVRRPQSVSVWRSRYSTLLSVLTVRNELLSPTALWTTSTLLDLKRYSYKCRCL